MGHVAVVAQESWRWRACPPSCGEGEKDLGRGSAALQGAPQWPGQCGVWHRDDADPEWAVSCPGLGCGSMGRIWLTKLRVHKESQHVQEWSWGVQPYMLLEGDQAGRALICLLTPQWKQGWWIFIETVCGRLMTVRKSSTLSVIDLGYHLFFSGC